jgi:hypothetical protein
MVSMPVFDVRVMKTNFLRRSILAWRFLRLSLLLVMCVEVPSRAQLTETTITDVRVEQTNLVVTAFVAPGIRRLTLECRERLGLGTWEPRAVKRTDGAGGVVTFRVPRSRQMEVVRVRGDAVEPLPASFYTGTNSFAGQASGGPQPFVLLDAVPPNSPADPGSTREVVESDIWKIRGQTLYFFNQLRGLQLIDIADPDAATVRGILELPAVGEDLYLLGATHAALLARDGCGSEGSQVIVVNVTNQQPTVVARLHLGGWVQESRLVGSALYVASQTYRPLASTSNTVWESGTLVSSFDLANPDSPETRDTLWFTGYGSVVTATDRLLFVATVDPTNWWRSIVRSIDITQPDGTMRTYASILVAGRVPDKFKLQWDGATLTSISEDWSGGGGRGLVTRLETFRLPDPRSVGPIGVVKLGELELGHGERLRATRFDGAVVYVVTFFQIDPLWVVDLSDPAAPRIAGSVDVPGWSTFIQPLGDRLVTVGIETNHVAVSLFDVANPSAPALLSRVRLGENYSWSEANWDERAFSVFPDAGLILVPYTGDTTNGYASRVQLIDLNANSLVARGVLEHQFQPRRATLYANRILSISGWELLSVDASDRDHPVVRGNLALAWTVDRVFLAGAHLIELSGAGGWAWWQNQGPVLRVALADSPNQILNQLALTNLPVIGATQRGSRLYVAQGQQNWFYPPIVPLAATDVSTDAVSSKLLLTVLGLDNLPAVQVLGQVEVASDLAGSADLQALWPNPDLLVWVGGAFRYWWWDFRLAPGIVAPNLWWWPPFWGGGGGHLVAFDVSNPASPEFASEVVLGTNSWWNFSQAFTTDGRVYLSHQASEFVSFESASPSSAALGDETADATGSTTVIETTNAAISGTWISRSYLDVVDYADARHPVVRQPVNIPGQLQGLSHQGAVLYTIGTHWATNAAYDWTEFLDASAYDGVSAHWIDSLRLPVAWPHPVRVIETNLFIGRPNYTNGYYVGPLPAVPILLTTADATAAGSNPGGASSEHTLETWFLSMEGRFVQSGSVSVANPVSALVNFDALLVSQQSDNTVTLFDASNGAALRLTGQGQPSGCVSFDVNHSAGELARGVWIALNVYGVARISAGP